MNQALVQDVVTEVMRRLNSRGGIGAVRAGEDKAANEPLGKESLRHPHAVSVPVGRYGIYATVDEAVRAADDSFRKLRRLSLDDRDTIVKMIKSIAKQNAQAWGEMELRETKIGRLDHKIEKLQILELVPGVEYLKTQATSGSNGVCIEEFAPFGVIGIITPVTHSIPTLSANAVNMIASGNAIVANPHPSGTQCAAHAVREYNKAIAAKFGIENLITCISQPTLETAEQLFNHRGVALLVVTGGPAVARAAAEGIEAGDCRGAGESAGRGR